MNAPPPRGFNPEEINPPVSAKGGMTALLHAAHAFQQATDWHLRIPKETPL